MRQSTHMSTTDTPSSIADKVIAMLPRLHVLVIGPGLGRDAAMQETCARVIAEARRRRVPFVLDADGLQLAQERGDELLKGCVECILTPNIVEFGRLCKARGVKLEGEGAKKVDQDEMGEKVAELARSFGGVTVLAKGSVDYISNGRTTLVSSGEGGRKRSGGQGDTLTGILGTLLAWRKSYLEKLWEHDADISSEDSLALVAFAGSAITRECSKLAYADKGRSLQAGDLTEKVHQAFLNTIGEPAETGKL
jgi:ATP-dependent NAD(P)H-hydrate dehydratase